MLGNKCMLAISVLLCHLSRSIFLVVNNSQEAWSYSWESLGLQDQISQLQEINPEYSLEGLMLKLKLQYFGHLMWRTDSLEKILMLGKVEGRRRRGQQRMRWLDGITISWSLLKLISIKSVTPSNYLILCCPLLLLPSIFPITRIFSNESVLHIRWPEFQLQHQSFPRLV